MSSSNSESRCQYKKADGRRCRLLRAPDHPSYCAQHAGWLTDDGSPSRQPREDLTAEILGPVGDFRTAASINYALGKLALLVAGHRISNKDAATLGYLFQLMLQSVQGVDHEIRKTRIDLTNESDDLRRILAQTASLLKAQA